MTTVWLWALIANYVVVLFAVADVLRRRKEPMAMLAWIFSIVMFPIVGMSLYALIGSTRVRRKAGRRRRKAAHLIGRARRRADLRTRAAETTAESSLPPELAVVEDMTRRLVGFPATSGNSVRVFEEANATYYAIEEAMLEARHHIHMQYYIWQHDATGTRFREILIQKAKEGVKCRVLLDAVGCFDLSSGFLQPLRDAGVHVAFFLPLNPLRRRWSINLRNHRKIAVVDGRIAFTGSQNVGDEYLGRLKKLSPWRDAHMRIEGPAVLFLQEVFLEDWSFSTREDFVMDDYFPEAQQPGSSIMQICPTGPDQEVRALEQIIFAAVTTARESIHIATPYFVPGPEIRMALIHAAYRGVRVQLVLPVRHDAPMVLWAGRSFYAELIQGGVEIYEYPAGVLHSKIIVVDESWCMLGSANMDVRSFRLNFEITALVYDPTVSIELSKTIERDRLVSRRINPQTVWNRSIPHQILEGAARLLSPLL